MTISEFFIRLDAKLSNKLWSWGAVAQDGTVILRCWAHEIRPMKNGKGQCVVVLDDVRYSKKSGGYNERVEHLQLIKDGKKARIVIVTDVSGKEPQGKIKHFKSDALMIVTGLFTEGKITYVEYDGIEKLTNYSRNV